MDETKPETWLLCEPEYDPNVRLAQKLLPSWFVTRMMTDEWYFGLLLTTGHVVAINHINKVQQAADGSIWIDVEMDIHPPSRDDLRIFGAPVDRPTATINAAHVVWAFELADT